MILLVDSKLMAYNVSYNADRPMTDMLTELKAISQDLMKDYNEDITRIVMGFDYGKSSFRKGMYEEYKGGRNYSKMPEDFQSNYRDVLPGLVEALGIGVMGVEAVECDDLIGAMIELKETTETIVLVTGDRDWLQLTINRSNVVMYDPRQHQYITTECKSIPQFLVEKTMKGDTSDNIYGVYMCGKVSYQKFKNISFEDKRSYTGSYDEQVKFLYKEYMDFCSSDKKFGVHAKYKAIGVNDFHDLFHFNMALGGIFTDTSLMTDVQEELFRQSLKALKTTKDKVDAEEAIRISRIMAGDRESMFGDPYEMPRDVIDYFIGIARD